MNRYLLRSLVALSTFLLGIAVSTISHPFHYQRWERKHQNYLYHERHCPQSRMFPTPSLSIDAAGTDPVKLVYSETRPVPNSTNQQVILVLDNRTIRPINSAVVKYSSQWPAAPGNENGSARVSYFASSVASSAQDLETVSIECGSNETLFLWISSVEFKDGSRWINPRNQPTF